MCNFEAILVLICWPLSLIAFPLLGFLNFVENVEEANDFSANPWISVAEAVKQDLFSSFQQVKDEIRGYELAEIKLTLVLRFGKILFPGLVYLVQ